MRKYTRGIKKKSLFILSNRERLVQKETGKKRLEHIDNNEEEQDNKRINLVQR